MDIFTKKFVLIPVVMNSHWSLAVLTNLDKLAVRGLPSADWVVCRDAPPPIRALEGLADRGQAEGLREPESVRSLRLIRSAPLCWDESKSVRTRNDSTKTREAVTSFDRQPPSRHGASEMPMQHTSGGIRICAPPSPPAGSGLPVALVCGEAVCRMVLSARPRLD